MCAFPKLSSSFWLDAEEAKLWSLTRRRPANQKHLYGKSCGGEGNLCVEPGNPGAWYCSEHYPTTEPRSLRPASNSKKDGGIMLIIKPTKGPLL